MTTPSLPQAKTLSWPLKLLLLVTSALLVAFGQPTSNWWIAALASLFGYAIYFRALIDVTFSKDKFKIGIAWFTAVQLVQLYWMLSHPYSYIYAVYLGFSLLWGLQWGVLSLLVTKANILSFTRSIAIASLWTLFEWSRLFLLSGYTWNPAGLALTANAYSLQMASIGGVFLLSFWVIFTNLLCLKYWLTWTQKRFALAFIAAATLPYSFGYWQIYSHIEAKSLHQDNLKALLVQTAFPAEEALEFKSKESYISYVLQEWKQILTIVSKFTNKNIDLIALPEYVVPLATYTVVYPYDEVALLFKDLFGAQILSKLPKPEGPFGKSISTNHGLKSFVNNAFFVQSIANIFDADVVAGLEDVEDDANGRRRFFSAALHFKPNATSEDFAPMRYAKRVLLPMAEYIPLSFFQNLAASYGIGASFTPGDKATIMKCGKHSFSPSICYEETFGNIMREAKADGAHILVNLTSDVWYPNSSLPERHRDHARLRTVENGIPLLRSCNTGVTCGIDCHGNTIATLGEGNSTSEWLSDALYIEMPMYGFETLYSKTGDLPIIAFSFLGLLLLLKRRKK